MKCAWKELLGLLPQNLRREVDRQGPGELEEVRLRRGQPVELVTGRGCRRLPIQAGTEELNYIVNAASRYSPWAQESMAQGYLSAAGGHRIGVCGECIVQNGVMTGLRRVHSLCIRVAKDYQSIARGIPLDQGSVLLIGPPGSGKTTLLRDLVRRIAGCEGNFVSVVDERGELFPVETDFARDCRVDVLSLCPKAQGIPIALKTMGPTWIAVDEITDPADCAALAEAQWCGVKLVSTAHAAGIGDLKSRKLYRPLVEGGLFETVIVLQPDKSWHRERM